MLVTANLENHWVSLHLWVSSLKWSLLLLGLLTESLDQTTFNGPLTLSSAYVCQLYVQKH